MSGIDDIINSIGRRQKTTQEPAGRQLARWAIAERMAPTLLEYQESLLEEVMKQVRELIAYIETNSLALQDDALQEAGAAGADGAIDTDIKIRLLVVETELERIKFTTRSYLRARIAKIDRFLVHFNISKSSSSLLSAGELQYAQRHLTLLKRHYNRSFFDSLPEELSGLTDGDEDGQGGMVDAPDLNTPVALRVTKPSGKVVVGGDIVELEKGGIYMLRYSAIADLIGDSVELV